jgi:hypothetical protein
VCWKIEKVPDDWITFRTRWKRKAARLGDPKAVEEPSNASKAKNHSSEVWWKIHADISTFS